MDYLTLHHCENNNFGNLSYIIMEIIKIVLSIRKIHESHIAKALSIIILTRYTAILITIPRCIHKQEN